MYAKSFIALDGNGRLTGARTAQAAPYANYTCHLCGSALRYHPQYDTELPWFEHTDDRLTEHGQQCPYVRPERREIQLIKRLQQFVPDALWALLRRQAELDGMPAINAKRVYRIMRQNALLLERKPAVPPSKRAHTGRVAVKESNQRWCSDGFEFCCDNGERLRVTFALDCCDREALHWAVTTGGFNSETVQDVMPGAVERRFGNDLPSSPVEWLTDNGSCYRANETRQFARMLGLEPKNTAVRSPESNGIAESFVKTIKRDYISIMPKPDGLTAAKNLAEAFEHYNEWHPHSALGYRSPREYLRQRACNGLSDNRCLEI